MKKYYSLLFLCAALVACKSTDALTFDVTTDADDASRQIELLQALEDVLNRRMVPANLEGAVTVTPTQDGEGELTVTGIPSEEMADAWNALIMEPFTFEVQLELPPIVAEGAAETTGAANWESTGITGEHLLWVQPLQHPETGEAAVELMFDDEGREKFRELFEEKKGNNLGVFVRDFLVSKLSIDTEELNDRIIISGIPSADVAEIFADDVNVGLHTTVVPR